MKPKVLFKAFYYTFQLTRCDECKLRKPALVFPVKSWNDISICRRCLPKILDEEYTEHYTLIGSVIYAFRECLEYVQWKERIGGDSDESNPSI